MKILVLNADYERFMLQYYGRSPELKHATYAEQMQARNDTLFGTADFYSRGFAAAGHNAIEVHVNNPWLQLAWARQHGMPVANASELGAITEDGPVVRNLKRRLRPLRPLLAPIARKLGIISTVGAQLQEVLRAQVEEFQPDVILNQDIAAIDCDFMKSLKRKNRILIAQCGVDPPTIGDLTVYDFGVSLIPWVVEEFRRRGLRAEHHHLGFGASILEALGPQPERDIDVSFVGSIGSAHGRRFSILNDIAQFCSLSVWTANPGDLPAGSALAKCVRGEVYGRDMYQILRRSKITLNNHINVSRGSAGNMRLFEATGIGAFLLTDNLADLPELFEPGREVAVYDSTVDAAKTIEKYLSDETAREDMARRGQSRTLTDHTYGRRTQELLGYIEKYSA